MHLQLENIRIHYQLYNSPKNNADYVVLIHGLGLDLTIWEPIIPMLQESYHVVTFDIRGHGRTTGPTDQLSWDVLVDDVRALVTALSIPSFHIIGYGFGGNLAIQYIEQYPENVKKLILTSVYMYFPKMITKSEVDKRKTLLTNGKMSELAKNLIHQICYYITPDKEILLTKAYEKIDKDTYFRLFHMLAETVSLEDLSGIEKEVLLIQGEKDPLFPLQQTNLYQSFLKNAASYIMPNASNLVPLDNPTSFITLVINFIKEGISTSFTSVMAQEFTDTIDNLYTNSFTTLEINIIDGFRVKILGEVIEDKWNQRKAKNLLAYLAYHNPATREELIDEFWRENDLNSAKNNLRVALNHLKRILQNHNLDSHLQINREHICLVGDISFDLANYMDRLNMCEAETNLLRKKSLYEDLMKTYKDRIFIDLYDDWLSNIQQEIEVRLHHIVMSITNQS
ncbi:alpha/beta hydrolase [Ornithinibacillus contaminans]|uniref:alpha/beta hydrolase n=1 Tax=Ornithinibacillus contaminans TaxID=694055 RepID=UPI00064DE9EB|nr:alpha/beta hydrolase [Ornithinibacillus contaminans]